MQKAEDFIREQDEAVSKALDELPTLTIEERLEKAKKEIEGRLANRDSIVSRGENRYELRRLPIDRAQFNKENEARRRRQKANA